MLDKVQENAEHEVVLDRMQARLDRMPEAMIIRRQSARDSLRTRGWADLIS